MISKDSLLRKLNALIVLLGEHEALADQQWKKEAFSSAVKMCERIVACVKAEQYEDARSLWKNFERFSDDSLPLTEVFLSRYMPLRRSIVNLGLQ